MLQQGTTRRRCTVSLIPTCLCVTSVPKYDSGPLMEILSRCKTVSDDRQLSLVLVCGFQSIVV